MDKQKNRLQCLLEESFEVYETNINKLIHQIKKAMSVNVARTKRESQLDVEERMTAFNEQLIKEMFSNNQESSAHDLYSTTNRNNGGLSLKSEGSS